MKTHYQTYQNICQQAPPCPSSLSSSTSNESLEGVAGRGCLSRGDPTVTTLGDSVLLVRRGRSLVGLLMPPHDESEKGVVNATFGGHACNAS